MLCRSVHGLTSGVCAWTPAHSSDACHELLLGGGLSSQVVKVVTLVTLPCFELGSVQEHDPHGSSDPARTSSCRPRMPAGRQITCHKEPKVSISADFFPSFSDIFQTQQSWGPIGQTCSKDPQRRAWRTSDPKFVRNGRRIVFSRQECSRPTANSAKLVQSQPTNQSTAKTQALVSIHT